MTCINTYKKAPASKFGWGVFSWMSWLMRKAMRRRILVTVKYNLSFRVILDVIKLNIIIFLQKHAPQHSLVGYG